MHLCSWILTFNFKNCRGVFADWLSYNAYTEIPVSVWLVHWYTVVTSSFNATSLHIIVSWKQIGSQNCVTALVYIYVVTLPFMHIDYTFLKSICWYFVIYCTLKFLRSTINSQSLLSALSHYIAQKLCFKKVGTNV